VPAAARTHRDVAGVVYTPPALAAAMVRRLIAELTPDDSEPRGLASMRVCDPALGEGAFLVELVRQLGDRVGSRAEVAARCVFGVDVDRRAVATARAAIEAVVGAPVPSLARHLRVADALADPWPDAPFDAVIANPPYVRHELLVAHKAALRGWQTADGSADLYVYFIELVHRLLRPGGSYCAVVPNKWMTVGYGAPLRRFLAREASVEGLVDLAGAPRVFRDADAFPCVLWGRRRAHDTEPGELRAARWSAHVPTSDDDVLASAVAPAAAIVPRARWSHAPWHIDRPDEARLLARLAAMPTLGEQLAAPPSRGIVTGCNRAFVLDRRTRDALLAREPAAAPLVRPLVRGRDLTRWTPRAIDRFVLAIDHGCSLGALPAVRAHLAAFRAQLEPRPPGFRSSDRGAWRGRKPGRYKWYELQDPIGAAIATARPRLLIQDIQSAPVCALDPDGALLPDTTVWALPSDDPWLLAVLNSRFYAWYARRRFPPALGGAVRPKRAYLSALPLPELDASSKREVTALVAAQRAHPAPERDRELDDLVFDRYGVPRRLRALVDM